MNHFFDSSDKDLGAAAQRLAAFRDSLNEGNTVCNECGLTAGDLDLILIKLYETRKNRSVPVLDQVEIARPFDPKPR